MADYSAHHPKGYEGQGDSHLPKIVRRLRRVLVEAQDDLAYDTLRLPSKSLGHLAGILVDFAEDLHADIGIWKAYERYNTEFFGAALPLIPEENDRWDTELRPDRFQHFLCVLYPMFFDDLTVSPMHQDLRRIADAASSFLSGAFADVPKDSGVKTFLDSSNEHGWDVKGKLVWLGTHSFMFRTMFARYIDEKAQGRADIPHTDDFVCQECTRWSGLGVIDILAGVLDISDDDRKDLRNWYERHAAFYKILSVERQDLEALNVINDRRYRIKVGMSRNPFKRGQLVFGSLVPWRGEWYWSGEQKTWDNAAKLDVDDLRRDMKRRSSRILCRYWKEYEAQVRERASAMHQRMLAFHGGKDLVVYPDGLAMAADWQKEIREQWDAGSPEEIEAAIKKHGLKKGRPEIKLPQDLLEQKDGLGVFLNPDEGKEIMTHFTTLVAGLRKRGEGLTEDEEAAVRGFVESEAVSPRFVRRVLEEYGDESAKAAFVLRGDMPAYWLDYLLRSRKGHFYRKRYPTLSVV